MDLVNDLFKYNNVFIKYMDQVKLYEDDFRMLDRYRAFLEMIDVYRQDGLFTEPRVISAIKRSMGINDNLFIESGDPIIFGLRKNIIDNYLKNKGR
jgi:hypothetical protein